MFPHQQIIIFDQIYNLKLCVWGNRVNKAENNRKGDI